MSISLHYNYRQIDQSKIADEAEEIDGENVSEVYLKECNLPSIPDWIFSLRNLAILKISSNKIERINDEILGLCNLELLDISCNKLTEINRNFFKLVKLKCLDFSGNRIVEIPSDIENLQDLEVFLFDRNPIHQLPDSLTRCHKIFQLSFEYCSNLSSIPRNLLNMENLRFISLRGCNLSTIPDKVSPKIQFCLLTENRLINHIPLAVKQHVFGVHASDFYGIPKEQLQHFFVIQTESIKYTRKIFYIDLGQGRIANVPRTFKKILNRHSKDLISLQELCLRKIGLCFNNSVDKLVIELPQILVDQLSQSSASCFCGTDIFLESFLLLFYQKNLQQPGILFSQYFCGKMCLNSFLEIYKDEIDILY